MIESRELDAALCDKAQDLARKYLRTTQRLQRLCKDRIMADKNFCKEFLDTLKGDDDGDKSCG